MNPCQRTPELDAEEEAESARKRVRFHVNWIGRIQGIRTGQRGLPVPVHRTGMRSVRDYKIPRSTDREHS